MTKAEWRRWAQERRGALRLEELSPKVVQALERWPPYRQAQHILSYLAFGSEIDLSRLDTRGKSVYVTRTHRRPPRLSVHLLDEALERHRLGFLQPLPTAPEIDPQVIDLALVPGLLFDARGGRLGYGLGYYDRLLPQLRPDALCLGVTVDALIVPELPSETHDVPVTHLLTESGVRAAR